MREELGVGSKFVNAISQSLAALFAKAASAFIGEDPNRQRFHGKLGNLHSFIEPQAKTF